MSNTVAYGETSWEDSGSAGNGQNSKDLFLRLNPGSNEMRIVTNPHKYLVHKVKKNPDDPKDFGQKVNCSIAHGSCPACDMGVKTQQRWFIGVISRKENGYRILDISTAVHGQIKKHSQSKHWGDPQKYDIDITVDPKGGAVGYYMVTPTEKSPLSAADQKIKDDSVDLVDLKRRTDPPTPEAVDKRMEKILGAAYVKPARAVKAAAAAVSSTSVKASVPEVSMTDDSADDFPDYASSEEAR